MTAAKQLTCYQVGGAVRDRLLGLPVHDVDWVVVGATPQQLLDKGFIAVGKDFPVFLHPQTKQEYALARTERKTGVGYHGFSVHAAADVTLEQDLARRDLTINAIAQSADGTLHDPYHGQTDLKNKVLRHVTDAFAEDPLRILRVARFAARFSDFTIAEETQTLMQDMVQSGEVDSLVAERTWQEISRGLMEHTPERMITVLRNCGALARILPEVNALFGVPQRAEYHPEIDTGEHILLVLNMAAQLQAPLAVRYACLCHDLGKATTPKNLLPRHIGHEMRSAKIAKKLSQRLRVPRTCQQLAEVVAREHGNIHRSESLSAAALIRLFERCDALRQPERFGEILLACECDARGRLGLHDQTYPVRPHLWQALQTVLALDAGAIANQAQSQYQAQPSNKYTLGEYIKHHLHQARVVHLRAWLQPPIE